MKRATWFIPILSASGAIWFVLLFLFQWTVVQAATTKWPDGELLYFLIQPIPFFVVSTLLPAGLLTVIPFLRQTKSPSLKPIAMGLLLGGFLFFLVYWYLNVHLFDNLI